MPRSSLAVAVFLFCSSILQAQQPDAAALVRASIERWTPLAGEVTLGAVSSRQESGRTVVSGNATVFGVQTQLEGTVDGASLRDLAFVFPDGAGIGVARVRTLLGTDLTSWLPPGLGAAVSLKRIELDLDATSVTAARTVFTAATWAAVSDDLLKLAQVNAIFALKNPTGNRSMEGALEGRLDLPAALMQMLGIDATHLTVRSTLNPEAGALVMSAAIASGVHLDSGGKIVINDARIELSLKPSRPALALAGKMTVDAGGTPLVFDADVAVDVRGRLFAEGWMTGTWDNPFGVSRDLHVHDLGIGFGLNFASPVPLPVLAFEGGIRVGDESAPLLEGALTLGLDPANPSNSMIDARLANLTLLAVVRAFSGGQVPDGLSAVLGSIGVNDVRLRVVPPGPGVDLFGVHHDPGFLVHGVLAFAGVGGEVLINIDQGGVEALAGVSPIKYPGFTMTAANDANVGPYIYLVTRPASHEMAFVVNGTLDVLGIRSTTDLYLSDAGFSATLSGQLMGMFNATLDIAGGNIFKGDTLFVKAELQNDFTAQMNAAASAEIKRVVDAARKQSDQTFTSATAVVSNPQLVVPVALGCDDQQRQLADLRARQAAKRSQQNNIGDELAAATRQAAQDFVAVGGGIISSAGTLFSSGSVKKAGKTFNANTTQLRTDSLQFKQLGQEISDLGQEMTQLGGLACRTTESLVNTTATTVVGGAQTVMAGGLGLAQGMSDGLLQAAGWLGEHGNPAQLVQITHAVGTICLSLYAPSQMMMNVDGVFAGQPITTNFSFQLPALPDPAQAAGGGAGNTFMTMAAASLASLLQNGGSSFGSVTPPCTRPTIPRPAEVQGISARIARLAGGGKATEMQATVTTRPEWAGAAAREASPITVLARQLESGAVTIAPSVGAEAVDAGVARIGAMSSSNEKGAAPAPPVRHPGAPTDGQCAAAIGAWVLEPDYRTHQIVLAAAGTWTESDGAHGEWRCDDVGGLITVLGWGEPRRWSVPATGGLINSRIEDARPVALPAGGDGHGSAALFGSARAMADASSCCKPGRVSIAPNGMANLYASEDQSYAMGTAPMIFKQIYSDRDARGSALFIRPAAFTVEGVPQGVTIQSARNPKFLLGYVGVDAAMVPWNPYWQAFAKMVSFRVQPGLNGRGVSFESVGRPGYYLYVSREFQDERLRLRQLVETEDFRRSATFDMAVDPAETPPALFDPPRILPGTNKLGINNLGELGAAVGNAYISRCDLRPESLAGVRVYADEVVHAIGLVCRDPDGQVLPANFEGRATGTLSNFMLAPDERVIAVSGTYNGIRGPYVDAIQFHTNKRSSPVFGNLAAGLTPFRFDIPAGLSFGALVTNFYAGNLRLLAVDYAFGLDTPPDVVTSATYRLEQAMTRAGVQGVRDEVRAIRANPALAALNLEYSFGRLLQNAGQDHIAALAIAQVWATDAPTSWSAQSVLSAQLLPDSIAASIMHAEMAVALAPHDIGALNTALTAYAADNTTASKNLEAKMVANPKEAWPPTALGMLASTPAARADSLFSKAIALDSAAWLPHAQLGLHLVATQSDRAFEHLRRALLLDPWAEYYIVNAGYAAIQKKDVALAIRLFQVVVDVRPYSYNGHDSLGEALALAGQKQRAIDEYEKSVALNPDNKNGREKLAALRAGQ